MNLLRIQLKQIQREFNSIYVHICSFRLFFSFGLIFQRMYIVHRELKRSFLNRSMKTLSNKSVPVYVCMEKAFSYAHILSFISHV